MEKKMILSCPTLKKELLKAAEERLPVLRPYMLRWSYLRPETVWIFSCPGRT